MNSRKTYQKINFAVEFKCLMHTLLLDILP